MTVVEMDLMGGYLLVVILMFSANISLLLGNKKLTNLKLLSVSLAISILSFVIFEFSGNLNVDLLNYFAFIFIGVSILVFLIAAYNIKFNSNKAILCLAIVYVLFTTAISSQSNLSLLDCLLYALCVFVTTFVVYKISKMLIYAKREYPVIVGEYMSLSSILLFIFGLTYYSTLTLDYSMFSPFLILTPTYQLIYVILFMVAVLVIGVVYNDNIGGGL